jgi:hypothetical protein
LENLTAQQSYNLEIILASKVSCIHGVPRNTCFSSQCYIHTPADAEMEPNHILSESEAAGFLAYLAHQYLET